MTYTERREAELMGAGGADGTGFQDSKQVLQAAVNMQKDALLSLERAERLQHVAEEGGQETLTTLQRQTEQMYQVDEQLANLQGELDRAARDVKWFYRQLAGDRCFLSLFGICVVSLAVLVFVMMYKKRHR
ncbi:putative QA-SNARE protein [Trypanosoma grayi]|uniref:putative QA-SNARE protein n=1 Tax=Trypanosoma grayi TaxID=71804 RepID=UPI0004F47B52|nr:putative QA-SNARE protein [Trypanosoma grayi]KEG09809.1 putative QA-SNARE protein [Trypanosoma grayi]